MYTLYDKGFLSIEKKVVSIIGLPILNSSSCLFIKIPSGEKISRTKIMLLLYKDSLKGTVKLF